MAESAKGPIIDPSLLIAGLALGLLRLARPLDSILAAKIFDLISSTPVDVAELAAKASQSDQYGILFLNTVLYLVYAAGGFICARYLQSASRGIALVQLLVLTVILVFPFNKLVYGLEPVSYLAMGLLGSAFGLLASKLVDASERSHTQQVESTLRNRQLMETRLQLIKQDEVERKMLAADLHDQVLNDLKLLLRSLEQNKETIGTTLITELNKRIELAMENIRKVMESLCPSDLEHIGLLASLEECLIERADKNDFIPQYRSSLAESDIQALNKIEKALLYRLVQESITNICKHAKASKVRLTAELTEGDLLIKIVDDGVGLKGEASSKSRGLQYMRLRAEIIGARISWNPGPEEKGTAVEIRINLARRMSSESADS